MSYQTPGVFIEEQPATGPIAGVGTSTAAFLGVAGKGPVAAPTLVTNLTSFTDQFVADGPVSDANAALVRGVRGFFENGGTAAYVGRVGVADARASVDLPGGDPAQPVLRLTARRSGTRGNAIKVAVQRPTATTDPHFTLVVTGPGASQTDTFADLSMDPADTAFVGSALADSPIGASLVDPAVLTPPARTASPVGLAGGVDATPGDSDGAWTAALAALAVVDDVSLVCAPGVTDTSVQRHLIDHCTGAGDRFAILDSTEGAAPAAVLAQVAALRSDGGFAALYYPWLTVPDPNARGQTLAVPPSGHVAGVFARVDAERGVHKAPANVQLAGVTGVERTIGDGDQGPLNVAGVNVLRTFVGNTTPVVWGARTTSTQTAYQYVNVRRLLLFVEKSIKDGIRWAVFEPNDLSLWKRLDRTVTEFLTRVWNSGALFGATAPEAFYVKIDQENNPPASQALGQVFVEVGIAPVRPAEYVVVRIGLWAGGGQVQEA